MGFKILIDPHPFLSPVQNWLQERYDVEFLYLNSTIHRYKRNSNSKFHDINRKLQFNNDLLFRLPSWFTENKKNLKRIVIQSIKDQITKYGPYIEALDRCLQNENISLILLWNDVTAITKSLTFLGKKHEIASLHVSHGLPYRNAVHGKIWAEKIAVFGESSSELYLAKGNPPEKVVITGNPYWDNWGPCSSQDRIKIKEALGLYNDKKIIMYAPTWYHNFNTAADPEFKIKKDLEIFLDTISQLKLNDKIELLVKLHSGQNDKKAFYERKIRMSGLSYKIIAESSSWPLIQVSDAILCSGSMVVEALMANKPVIYNVCDHFESELHFDFLMSHLFTLQQAPFYVALRKDDLQRGLSRALNNCSDFSADDIKKFLHRQNGPCDGRATERVAELAMEMAGKKNKKEKRVKFTSPVSYQKREAYYSNLREDIPSMISSIPERILEIGCAEGIMGEWLKKRYNCEYVGVEINKEAALKAKERLDDVIIADVEKTNLKDHRISEKGFDYIIYGDVLEHLYDPWTVIYEHKKLLKDDGYVVVSIPNVRHLPVIESLVNGNWTYKDEGILDSTHLRFFTLQEVKKMFANCGYAIVDIKCITAPFCDHSKLVGTTNIDLPKLTIKNVSKKEMLELSTVQFIVKAQKAAYSKSKRHPKCSIIIPIFNQVQFTKQCVEALYKNTPNSLFELIIVDNNSTDGTKEFLSSFDHNIQVISNPENLGFAKACNQGAKKAEGKYLLFLNNDTVPFPGWLEELINTANSNSAVGIVGSKLLYPDDTIQHAGLEFINGIPDHAFRNFPGDHPEANRLKELDMVTGACLLIKKDLFFECGGFDEQYKNGVEDIDLCLKVRMNGYKVIYNPKSTLYHYEGKTPGRYNHVKENLEIFFARWEKYFDDKGRFICKAEDQKLLIRWEGSQFVNHSLALVNRELCIELAKTNDIEVSLIPYEPDEFGAEEDPERFGLITERLNSSLPAAADFHVRHQWPPNFTPPTEGHWIMIQPWEFGALPKDWVEPMQVLVDELWVPSNHVRDVYIKSGVSSDRVFVVPNGVNYDQFHPEITKLALDTDKNFKFLFVGGTIMRKGIDVLLSAYVKSFTSQDDVCLVIKDMGGESFYKGQNASQMIGDIKKNPSSPQILYLTESFKQKEMAGLYTACDCLVHPYRGEGFGLPVAEAMACGLPVIVTRGGACDDFCSEENAYLINATVRPVHLNNCELSAPGWLLEPDKSKLIEMLKYVYQNPDKAREKGAIATRQIKKMVDWKLSKELVMDRLRALKAKPVRRFVGSVDHQEVEALKSPEEIYQTIQQSMQNKSPKEVINELELLTKSYPEFALAHNDLGVLHYNVGHKEKAQQFYEKAVQLDPENMVFQKNLADLYCIELGRIEDALKIYVNVLRVDPQDVETLMATGHICKVLEKFDDARHFFNQVLQIEPWNADARKHAAEIENQLSGASVQFESVEDAYRRLQGKLKTVRPAKAVDEFKQFVEAYPNFAIGHNDLANLYYNAGNKEKALRHYQQAVQLQPANITLQKNLADFLFVGMRKLEDALQIYVNLLNMDPHDTETLLIAGHMCVALKKFDDAIDFYEQLLAIEPENEDARKNLQALNNRRIERTPDSPDALKKETSTSVKVEATGIDTAITEIAEAEPQKTVSIIVNLDGIQNRIKQCIESITAHTAEPHEIILLNNGTTKGVLKWAQKLVKDNSHYQMQRCDKRYSWAQCLNQAVKAATGDYIVLMHNDVLVAERWFSGLRECVRAKAGIGVVGPLTNETTGIQKIHIVDDWDPNRLASDAQSFYEQNQYRRIPTIQLASFCLMFSRELIEEIGGFDAQLVSEQAVVTDFCKRSAAWGFQNYVAGDVFVYHANRHKRTHTTSNEGQIPIQDKERLNSNWSETKGEQRLLKGIQMVSLLETVNELHQKGHIEQAIETLLNTIGALPDEKRFYLALGQILISSKRYQDAIDAISEMPAGEKDPIDSEQSDNFYAPGPGSILPAGSENLEMKTLEILGYAEEGLENFALAEDYAEQMLAIDAKSARAFNLKGILAFRKKDLSAAAQFFESAIASDRSAGEPYSNLAAVKLAANNDQEALKLIEKGFILSPTDFDIASNYHAIVSESGDYHKAEKAVSEAAALYPNNQKIAYMLIDFLVQQGRYDEAMDKIEAAIVKFGIEDGILAASLQVRKKLGPMRIKSHQNKPAVSCCMIIKNEEKYLARCLASVKPIVDEIVVVDTGSADRSKDIAAAFGAQVYDFEWQKDFAKARNFSLEKASGDWILIIDGDEVISSLDYKDFNQIVKKRPKAPVAYTIVTRNYSALANIVGWVPNDGKYNREEAAAGWIPSVKTRLFYGKDQIWFEGAVHELVDPVVKRKGFKTKQCSIPVHHYGRLDKERLTRKGEVYFEIGKKKMEEMGDDIFAIREMAIQATTLERNEMAINLWRRLITLDPPELMVVDAYINMATLYNRLGNFEQSLLEAKKAMAKAPHIKESLYNYALAELHVGNAQATIKVLEDLVKRMPDYPPARFILSAAYFCIADKEKGFKIIRKLQATVLGPNLIYPVAELAETLLNAQQNEFALRLLGAAIEGDIVNKRILELFNKCLQLSEKTENYTESLRVVAAGSAAY